MSQFEVDEIKSVADAIKIVQDLETSGFVDDNWPFHKFPFGIWFRGQSRQNPLEPSVFRKIESSSPDGQKVYKVYDETNIYEHVQLRAPQYGQTYRSAFDWLCLMQHYALPTRLLDWSENILSALYFAVRRHRDNDGEIILLNARRLNRYVIGKRPRIARPQSPGVIIRAEMATTRSSIWTRRGIHDVLMDDKAGRAPDNVGDQACLDSYRCPIAVFPHRYNDRMVFQSSVFTLHGGKIYPKGVEEHYKELIPSPISLENINEELSEKKSVLKRYRVPYVAKDGIKKTLLQLGIHEGSLYPEIDRQAEYLKEMWLHDA